MLAQLLFVLYIERNARDDIADDHDLCVIIDVNVHAGSLVLTRPKI